MILSPQGTQIRQHIDAFLTQNAIQISRLQVDSSSIMTNVGVLQATDSIAFLSRDVAEQFANDGLLARLPLSLSDTRMRIGAIWMRERHMAMELKLVHMVLRECTQMIATGEAEAQAPRWPMQFEPQPLHHHEFW